MIAILVPEGADWKNVKVPSANAKPAATADKVTEKPQKETVSAPPSDHSYAIIHLFFRGMFLLAKKLFLFL